jgi:hypothetical protein
MSARIERDSDSPSASSTTGTRRALARLAWFSGYGRTFPVS